MASYAQRLLETAERLAKASPKRPRISDLNRAVSTAYYAMYDALCSVCATEIVGPRALPTPSDIWRDVYRSVEHVAVKKHLESGVKTSAYGADLSRFAKAFSKLQQQRHDADYNPQFRIGRAATLRLIAEARDAIKALTNPQLERQKMVITYLVVLKTR